MGLHSSIGRTLHAMLIQRLWAQILLKPLQFLFFSFLFLGGGGRGEGGVKICNNPTCIDLYLLKFMHTLLLPFLLFHKDVINVILLKAVDHFQIVQPEDWLNSIW